MRKKNGKPRQFQERFTGLDINILWTTVLDPRFRSLKHLTEPEKKRAKELFIKEAYELAMESNNQEEEQSEPDDEKEAKGQQDGYFSTMFDTPPKNVVSSQVYMALRNRIKHQVDSYMDLNNVMVDSKQCPLAWWNKNWSVYSLIAPVARKWLCVPATSTPSERVFSDCGLAGTAKRGSLNAETLQNQVFLRRNMKTMGFDAQEIVKVIKKGP